MKQRADAKREARRDANISPIVGAACQQERVISTATMIPLRS